MKQVIAALALVALAGVLFVVLRPDPGAERVKAMIDWEGCADVVVGHGRGWSDAEEHATIVCEHAGPLVEYARFASEAELRHDLLDEPPSMPVCLAGLEVTVDYLDRGQFERLCRDMHGVRVDAIDYAAEPPWFSENDDARYDAWVRASAQAQKRALERHWHG